MAIRPDNLRVEKSKSYFVFITDICNSSAQQSNLLHLPAVRTEVVKKCIYYHHGSLAFNNIVNNVYMNSGDCLLPYS